MKLYTITCNDGEHVDYYCPFRTVACLGDPTYEVDVEGAIKEFLALRQLTDEKCMVRDLQFFGEVIRKHSGDLNLGYAKALVQFLCERYKLVAIRPIDLRITAEKVTTTRGDENRGVYTTSEYVTLDIECIEDGHSDYLLSS